MLRPEDQNSVQVLWMKPELLYLGGRLGLDHALDHTLTSVHPSQKPSTVPSLQQALSKYLVYRRAIGVTPGIKKQKAKTRIREEGAGGLFIKNRKDSRVTLIMFLRWQA